MYLQRITNSPHTNQSPASNRNQNHNRDHIRAFHVPLIYRRWSVLYPLPCRVRNSARYPVLPKKEGQEGNLLSPYALTKRVDEEFAKLYTRLYGLDTYGLRYFNVFGRRQDPDGAYAAVIPKFIKMLMNGETPTINGDGMQSRDFTYIENVIEANLKACLAPHEAAGNAFNIAYGGREYLIDIYHSLSKVILYIYQPSPRPRQGRGHQAFQRRYIQGS